MGHKTRMNESISPRGSNEIRKVSEAAQMAKAVATRHEHLKRLGIAATEPELGSLFQDEYVSLIRDPVRFPSGQFGTYLRIEERSIQNGIAGVVVVPKFAEQVFLQRIYRYPTQSWEWEFPRGLMEPGYSPEEMARRELFEETGLSVERIQEIGTVFSNTGLLSGAVKVFVADVKEAAGTAAPEDGEAIGELISMPSGKLWAMVRDGGIRDGFTLSAMSLALAKRLLQPD
jgi:ADP-ribose pyrophosphatase